MEEYMESCCCFDAAQYTGTPDSSHIADPVDVPKVLAGLDALNNSGREADGEAYLEEALSDACSRGDWRAEISFLSELLGQYRRSGNRDAALRCVEKAMSLIRIHCLGQTISGATVLLNAATTMKCFGLAKESLPVFRHVSRVFAEHLDPHDYRFAGLYNNMALSFGDAGDPASAERYFRLALQVLESCPNSENDCAVTWCNLAELYDSVDHMDPRIEPCMEHAWAALNTPSLPRDGYHAFTVSKCTPAFDYFGYFLYAEELRRRVKEIYEERT